MMKRKSLSIFLSEVLPGYQGLSQIAGDASFRRYFRVWQQGISYIVMDAPPPKEDVDLFAQVAIAFAQAGLNVPEIIDSDSEAGYLLLSDFGDEVLQSLLIRSPHEWLPVCLETLLQLQTQGGQHLLELPAYDHPLLLQELSLFPVWFITECLDEKLNHDEESLLHDLNELLIDSALKQPQTWVHRDYHSRNLMRVDEQKLGIIDFQDAVLGAVTYDLASILKDCYIRYPVEVVAHYLYDYYLRLVAQERYYHDFEQFERDFDLMGLQRHLKVLGIFSRLSIRDGKHDYLQDLPLVFDYVLEVLEKYPELNRYLSLFNRLRAAFDIKLPVFLQEKLS